VLDTATWRANPDWAAVLGHDLGALGSLIDECVRVVADVRDLWRGGQPFLISGVVGPRGDGYRVEDSMTAEASADYHEFQIERMTEAGVDVVTALTIGYVGEAAGVALAARAQGVPVVVSFTVETDGRLPTGMPLAEAIEATDAATGAYPLHYMINCAHPTHFGHVLDPATPWAKRIGGIRANASELSHAELDQMVELDEGDPDDLARHYLALRSQLPNLHVLGGCCGTDRRHVAAIASAWQG
jgi:S-methylmethionine-dependent homocysteine/selenocysteine methylase